jgi:hypothetical protein
MNEIPPGPSDLECTLKIGEPGPFSAELHLFVDDGGTREIVFTIHWTAKSVTGQ